MFLSRIRPGWTLAVVVILAAALMAAAGATARSIQPTSPWYAYDAALRNAQHQRQQHTISSVQPTSPWYAYDAALRNAQHQRQQHRPAASSRRVRGTHTTPHSGTRSTSGSSTRSAASSRRVRGTHTTPHSGTRSTSGSSTRSAASSRRVRGTHTTPHSGTRSTSGSSKSLGTSASANRIMTDTLGGNGGVTVAKEAPHGVVIDNGPRSARGPLSCGAGTPRRGQAAAGRELHRRRPCRPRQGTAARFLEARFPSPRVALDVGGVRGRGGVSDGARQSAGALHDHGAVQRPSRTPRG